MSLTIGHQLKVCSHTLKSCFVYLIKADTKKQSHITKRLKTENTLTKKYDKHYKTKHYTEN